MGNAIILPSSKIAIGHCVIINHVEQPCGRLLSVVIGFDGDRVKTKYLTTEKFAASYNRHGCLNQRKDVTPAGDFGVDVFYEPDTSQYWCEQLRESIATYHDGRIRPWQERDVRRYVARALVVQVAIRHVAKPDST